MQKILECRIGHDKWIVSYGAIESLDLPFGSMLMCLSIPNSHNRTR